MPSRLHLLLISDGKPGAVLLEWSGGADATGWQYRFNKTDPFTNRAPWRDIPGGCPATHRYRLTGQLPLPPRKPGTIHHRTSQYLQVRPLMGATAGQASPYVEWVRVWPFRPTFTLSPALVQGDGRTEWYSFGWDLALTLPAGVRLLGEERLEFCPSIRVQCNYSVSGEMRLTDVASGSLLILDWRTGEEKKRIVEDGHAERLFDQLAASVRKTRGTSFAPTSSASISKPFSSCSCCLVLPPLKRVQPPHCRFRRRAASLERRLPEPPATGRPGSRDACRPALSRCRHPFCDLPPWALSAQLAGSALEHAPDRKVPSLQVL